MPAPDFVMPKVLEPSSITPLNVRVPVPPKILLAPNVMLLESEAVPVPLNVPPFNVIPSLPMATPLISNVAPFETIVPAAVVPNAFACATERVPALTVVVPV